MKHDSIYVCKEAFDPTILHSFTPNGDVPDTQHIIISDARLLNVCNVVPLMGLPTLQGKKEQNA